MLSALNSISRWAIPILLLAIPAFGIWRRVPVYESFVTGAKEGVQTALRIIPYLVAMFAAVQIFRQSGAMDNLISLFEPFISRFNIPTEVLPLALIRPLSGSGSLGLLSNILEVHGPDSIVGRMAATLMGSTETTFYVLTVYFGAVGIRKVRHSIAACLAADLAGFLMAVYVVLNYFS